MTPRRGAEIWIPGTGYMHVLGTSIPGKLGCCCHHLSLGRRCRCHAVIIRVVFRQVRKAENFILVNKPFWKESFSREFLSLETVSGTG